MVLVSFSSVDRRLPGRAGETWPMGGGEEQRGEEVKGVKWLTGPDYRVRWPGLGLLGRLPSAPSGLVLPPR